MKIWIDITNSPHVIFFRPILRRLREAGIETIVTTRDYAQTLGLLQLYGIPYTSIGRHAGRNVTRKALALAGRSAALIAFARGQGIAQAVSHGSYDLSIAAKTLGIHNTVLHDYEGARMMHHINFRLADKVMTPQVIPLQSLIRLGLDVKKYRPYPGIKEQISLADFDPDPSITETLSLDRERPIAVLRPPATMSLYHRFENPLFNRILDHLTRIHVQVVLLPRTPAQAAGFTRLRGVIIPEKPVDGPSLIYAADLVVSAGGTMNREAAVLGTPAYTTFGGNIGAVDQMLIKTGKLRVLTAPEGLKIEKHTKAPPCFAPLADAVTQEVLKR